MNFENIKSLEDHAIEQLTRENERLKGELAQAKAHNAALLEACKAFRKACGVAEVCLMEQVRRFERLGRTSHEIDAALVIIRRERHSAIALEKGEK